MTILQRTALFSGLALLAIIALVVVIVVSIRSRRRRTPAVVIALIMLGVIVLSIVLLFGTFTGYVDLALNDSNYNCFGGPASPQVYVECLTWVAGQQPTKYAAETQLAPINQVLRQAGIEK